MVGEIYDIDIQIYKETFDILYLEGAILHYFSDIGKFTEILYKISKQNGKLVLSDFHAFRKLIPMAPGGNTSLYTNGDYFDYGVHDGELAYANELKKDDHEKCPTCKLRYYILSEIINAGFVIKEFTKHPS